MINEPVESMAFTPARAPPARLLTPLARKIPPPGSPAWQPDSDIEQHYKVSVPYCGLCHTRCLLPRKQPVPPRHPLCTRQDEPRSPAQRIKHDRAKRVTTPVKSHRPPPAAAPVAAPKAEKHEPTEIGGKSADIAYNVDKRTKRKQDAQEFESAIQKYRTTLPQEVPLTRKDGTAGRGLVTVCIRKRPMFSHESVEKSEFDVVTCVGEKEGFQPLAVVHQCGSKMIPRRGPPDCCY